MNKTSPFDYLVHWYWISDEELEKEMEAYSYKLINQIHYLLYGKKEYGNPTNLSEFRKAVDNFYEYYKESARALGDAIIKASECVDQEDLLKAKAIYTDFINSKYSDFHRSIAKQYVQEIETGRIMDN